MEDLELERMKLQLKVQALQERISELTTSYEDRIADLRVNVTLLSQQVQQHENNDREVLEGEVVSE